MRLFQYIDGKILSIFQAKDNCAQLIPYVLNLGKLLPLSRAVPPLQAFRQHLLIRQLALIPMDLHPPLHMVPYEIVRPEELDRLLDRMVVQ